MSEIRVFNYTQKVSIFTTFVISDIIGEKPIP